MIGLTKEEVTEMSIYNAGIPTMPFYDVTKRTFGEMMTP